MKLVQEQLIEHSKKIITAIKYFYDKYGMNTTFSIGNYQCSFMNVKETEVDFDYNSGKFFSEHLDDLYLFYVSEEEIEQALTTGEVDFKYEIIDFETEDFDYFLNLELGVNSNLDELFIKHFESETLKIELENSLKCGEKTTKKTKI